MEKKRGLKTQIPIEDRAPQEIIIETVVEGKSAYDLAVERGYEGTVDDWVNSLGTGLDASIEQAGESKTALDGSIEQAGDIKQSLDASVEQAGESKTALDGSVTSAGTMKDELDESITSATNINDTLANPVDGTIKQANDSKDELDGSITSATNINDTLANPVDGTIKQANDSKDELDGSITSATNINNTLADPVDGTIKQANDSRVALEGKITDAGTAKSEIEQAIVDNQIVTQSEFTQHKLDYAEDIGTVANLTTTSKEVVGAVNELDALKADLSEIEAARGTELTLGARLDSTDAQLNNMTQDFTQHQLDYMPHRFENKVQNKTYKFGFQVSDGGSPQIIFEEVI